MQQNHKEKQKVHGDKRLEPKIGLQVAKKHSHAFNNAGASYRTKERPKFEEIKKELLIIRRNKKNN